MAYRHGTLTAYNSGCRCGDCVDRNASYRQQRRAEQGIIAAQEPGPVELGVLKEIGLAVEQRPGLAASAVALARLLDNPRTASQHPAAAKTLASLLDTLGKAGGTRRRSHLAVVREMTEKGGA
jgi:hypothetical protein